MLHCSCVCMHVHPSLPSQVPPSSSTHLAALVLFRHWHTRPWCCCLVSTRPSSWTTRCLPPTRMSPTPTWSTCGRVHARWEPHSLCFLWWSNWWFAFYQLRSPLLQIWLQATLSRKHMQPFVMSQSVLMAHLNWHQSVESVFLLEVVNRALIIILSQLLHCGPGCKIKRQDKLVLFSESAGNNCNWLYLLLKGSSGLVEAGADLRFTAFDLFSSAWQHTRIFTISQKHNLDFSAKCHNCDKNIRLEDTSLQHW